MRRKLSITPNGQYTNISIINEDGFGNFQVTGKRYSKQELKELREIIDKRLKELEK